MRVRGDEVMMYWHRKPYNCQVKKGINSLTYM